MSFLLLLFPAALAIGLYLRHFAPKQAFCIVGASLAVVALVLIFGAVRLAQPSPRQQVTVGLVTSDEPADVDVAAEGADLERLFIIPPCFAWQAGLKVCRILPNAFAGTTNNIVLPIIRYATASVTLRYSFYSS